MQITRKEALKRMGHHLPAPRCALPAEDFRRYTQKRWLVEYPPVGESGFKVKCQYGTIANVVPRNSKEDTESIAFLLAAAPDLLAALRQLIMMARTSGGTAGPDAELIKACGVAESAIAMAKGE